MIGDVGGDPTDSKVDLDALNSSLLYVNDKNNAVIFLGDIIYPEGMHKKYHAMRAQDEECIDVQIPAI
ncbi:MAG: hypothetical protein CMO34_01630 [Verrucomicrobia bacterium]|nr:hypothetical protein [Verrucomicrobiota bacterium]